MLCCRNIQEKKRFSQTAHPTPTSDLSLSVSLFSLPVCPFLIPHSLSLPSVTKHTRLYMSLQQHPIILCAQLVTSGSHRNLSKPGEMISSVEAAKIQYLFFLHNNFLTNIIYFYYQLLKSDTADFFLFIVIFNVQWSESLPVVLAAINILSSSSFPSDCNKYWHWRLLPYMLHKHLLTSPELYHTSDETRIFYLFIISGSSAVHAPANQAVAMETP